MVPYASFLYFGIAGLYVFLPALLARVSRAITPPRVARVCILAGSILMVLVQYSGFFGYVAWGGLAGKAGIVLGYVGAQYLLALALLRVRSRERWKKAAWPIWTAVLLAVVPLAWAKAMLSAHGPLPLFAFAGLSYLTFRVVDVLVSIHDGLVKTVPAAQFFAFTLFFPTLSAGPIDRWRRFSTDWNRERPRREVWSDLDTAIRHVSLGFLYKFILAHAVKVYWLDTVPPGPGFWHTVSYMYAYSAYLFFDFAGYSAFAVGISHVLGVYPPENFRQPFLSRDIKDFWTRWHISLSFWFRDFVYMRFLLTAIKRKWFKSQYHAAYAGNLVTFGLMGLWHGLAWNYIIYGLYHAALMTGFDLFARWNRPKPTLPPRLWGESVVWQAAAIGVTMHCVFFGFLIFSGHRWW
jgi:membrane protein involved in D-alanine export